MTVNGILLVCPFSLETAGPKSPSCDFQWHGSSYTGVLFVWRTQNAILHFKAVTLSFIHKPLIDAGLCLIKWSPDRRHWPPAVGPPPIPLGRNRGVKGTGCFPRKTGIRDGGWSSFYLHERFPKWPPWGGPRGWVSPDALRASFKSRLKPALRAGWRAVQFDSWESRRGSLVHPEQGPPTLSHSEAPHLGRLGCLIRALPCLLKVPLWEPVHPTWHQRGGSGLRWPSVCSRDGRFAARNWQRLLSACFSDGALSL